MINRKELEEKLNNILENIIVARKEIEQITDYLFRNHNMTIGQSNEYLMGMKSLSGASVEELLWITKAIALHLNSNHSNRRAYSLKLDDYFSKPEMISYQKSKVPVYHEEVYPIVFENVLQVNDDQWVCVVDVDFLYQLYKRQLINYNKNTQRPLTKRSVNGVETYHITLKTQSVREIKELLSKSLFISNDISLNLNLDNQDVSFSYEKNSIIVHSGQLDIIDGYHRFRAMMMAKAESENFNYKFIVNIMNFDENKACTYIAQEDKRNRISKQYSRSLDSTNLANTVVKRLNEDATSYLCGSINKNGTTVINSVYLFNLIDSSFVMSTMQDAVKITKYLKDIFNSLIEEQPELLKNISSEKLAIIVIGASKTENVSDALLIIRNAFKKESELDERKFKRQGVNKSLINEIDKIL